MLSPIGLPLALLTPTPKSYPCRYETSIWSIPSSYPCLQHFDAASGCASLGCHVFDLLCRRSLASFFRWLRHQSHRVMGPYVPPPPRPSSSFEFISIVVCCDSHKRRHHRWP